MPEFDEKTICVWTQENAPESFKWLISDDVDWICYVPAFYNDHYISWVNALGICETVEFEFGHGTVYIGTHA